MEQGGPQSQLVGLGASWEGLGASWEGLKASGEGLGASWGRGTEKKDNGAFLVYNGTIRHYPLEGRCPKGRGGVENRRIYVGGPRIRRSY